MGKKDKTVVAEEAVVDVVVCDVEKKKKKKKRAAEEVVAEATEETQAPCADEEEPAKKKKKKSKKTEEVAEEGDDMAVEVAEAEVVGEKKKKKKSKKVAEEVVEEEKAAEEEKEESEEEKEEAEKKEEAAETPAAGEGKGDEIFKVFIGNLSFRCTEDNIRSDFGECGEMTDFALPMNEEGKMKGFAIITYATKEGMDKALAYNEQDYYGRDLRVQISDSPNGNKGGKKGKGKKGGKDGKPRERGEKPEGCKSIILKNMSYDTVEDSIWAHFDGLSVERVKLLTDRETGASRGVAFIDFESTEAMDKAIAERDDKELDGRKLFLDYSGGANEGKGKDGGKKGGKGKGKDGKKGKGKGKGKKGKDSDPAMAARNGSIQAFTGTKMAIEDSDSE